MIQVTCCPAVSGTVDLLALLAAISKYTPLDVAGALMSAGGVDAAIRKDIGDIELVAEGTTARSQCHPSIWTFSQPRRSSVARLTGWCPLGPTARSF